jgi:putative two-component system response regulator
MLRMARQIALSHHERWNGGGYPAGLAGRAIPEAARIMAIVDAFDSLTHERVYRPAMSEEAALEIMRYGDGKDFDPALLALFFRDLPLIRGISARHPDEPQPAAADSRSLEPGPNCLPGDLAAWAAPAAV